MHVDEIAEIATTLTVFDGARVTAREGRIAWKLPPHADPAGLACTEVTSTLDSDGQLFMVGTLPVRTANFGDACIAINVWCYEAYLQILRKWSVLYDDVLRGVVKIGVAGLAGYRAGSRLRVMAAHDQRFVGTRVAMRHIRPLLLTEACRQYVYSTTERFRQFGKELNSIRDDAIVGEIDRAAEISVAANARIDASRTIRNRLEIAVQTIQHRLANYPESVSPYQRELSDLILVAEHMQAVWRTQEGNFEWVVQHVNLRAGIAERASTRSFTAAVFAVAVVALMRDVAEWTLSIGIIQWNTYRVIVIAIGCLAVAVLSYLLYLLAKRIIK